LGFVAFEGWELLAVVNKLDLEDVEGIAVDFEWLDRTD
jgi:hypothetical protein